MQNTFFHIIFTKINNWNKKQSKHHLTPVMQPAISVIVPIYKAEKYLKRCLDSIISQTFTDFELILIDDGSPDKSGMICDEYALNDKRIKVIHKKNGGVASARQCGIDNTKGEYTIHADPDDWVEPSMLEKLYKKAVEENADMVICDFWTEEKDRKTYNRQEPTKAIAEKTLQDILQHRLHGSLCNKLIKSTCYTDYNIRFIEGLNYCEDYLVCIKILLNGIKVSYLNEAFYHYDKYSNPNCITKDYNIAIYNSIHLLKELQEILKEEIYLSGLYHQTALFAIEAIKYPTLTSKEYKSIFKKQHRQILPHIKGYAMKSLFVISAYGYKDVVYSVSNIVRKIKRSLVNKGKNS